MKIIARIYTDFKEKFGIPRQSGIAKDSVGKIVFEPEFRIPEALRGIEGYSHLWLIWGFHKAERENWSPTVRPPRLGGNKRMGVFATRSPFRPNPIGLSSVRLIGVNTTDEGTVLTVGGADILDGTPLYDIKPYLPYTDSHPDAVGGFAEDVKDYRLEIKIPKECSERIPCEERATICELLSQDPRPSYKEDGERIYGMKYGKLEIFFKVANGAVTVTEIKDI